MYIRIITVFSSYVLFTLKFTCMQVKFSLIFEFVFHLKIMIPLINGPTIAKTLSSFCLFTLIFYNYVHIFFTIFLLNYLLYYHDETDFIYFSCK